MFEIKVQGVQLRLLIKMTLKFCGKMTPLSIFRDLAARKRDSKKLMVYLYVFPKVFTNIPNLFGLVHYPLMDFLGVGIACVSFETKIQ